MKTNKNELTWWKFLGIVAKYYTMIALWPFTIIYLIIKEFNKE